MSFLCSKYSRQSLKSLACCPCPRIYYGDRVHYLATRASVEDIRQIMASMSLVVQAMLKRVEIDLAEDEIGLALQGFHLECWQATNNHAALKAHLQRLCVILGVPNVGSLLAAAAKKIAPVFESAKARRLGVDNRQAWTWALHPAWRVKYAPNMAWNADCDFVVQFYLSLKINTTTLERDLGDLLAQLSSHSGPLAADGATMAHIMEVNVEGPQHESDFFSPAEKPGLPLQPSDFAQLCQKLWLQHFGRRFRYSYLNRSKVQSPKSKVQGPRSHAPGSLAGRVHGRARAAVAAAQAKKHESFIPGMKLPLTKPCPTLSGTRWETAPCTAAKQALENFEKHTQRKKDRIKCYAFRNFGG